MLDYVRCIFRLDFCIPRYVIEKELRMNKLRIGWGIRAMRYEEKLIGNREESLIKKYWKEIEEGKWEEAYGKE